MVVEKATDHTVPTHLTHHTSHAHATPAARHRHFPPQMPGLVSGLCGIDGDGGVVSQRVHDRPATAGMPVLRAHPARNPPCAAAWVPEAGWGPWAKLHGG